MLSSIGIFTTLAASWGVVARLRKSIKRDPFPVPQSLQFLVDEPEKLHVPFNKERYVKLLESMIAETAHLQNCPPEYKPEEDRIAQLVVAHLLPFSKENGGPLEVNVVSYADKRSNMVIKLPGKTDYNVGLVGSHFDVVPANPEKWTRDPFKLVVEGDKLYGRGTTDCLGHVALVTCLFEELAKAGTQLNCTLTAVFIANEEDSSVAGVGVDGLMKDGHLDCLKKGTSLWVDTADSQPCIGTATCLPWEMRIAGKGGHSGLPNNSINPIELANQVIEYIQDRFYLDYPPCASEQKYQFLTPSTMKPTKINSAPGGGNVIPQYVDVTGDIRVTPFYDGKQVMKSVDSYIQEANNNLNLFSERGPCSKYTLPKENVSAKIDLVWEDPDCEYRGIACDIESPGFVALKQSIQHIRGSCKPYSIGGSLPLVRDMQEAGYDLQLCGFGLSQAYHADDEYCLLSDMEDGMKILSLYISKLDAMAAKCG